MRNEYGGFHSFFFQSIIVMAGADFIRRYVCFLLLGAFLISNVIDEVHADEEPSGAGAFRGRSILNMTSRTLRVTTIVEYPYLTLKENGESLSGNDRFEGYCKKVLELLANKLGFKYELHLVKDSRFGNADEIGYWDGMIGEILQGEADMAVSSMILNRARAEVVDFSVTFADFRLAVLIRRPNEPPPVNRTKIMSSFNFLLPLKPSLWILTIAMGIVTVGYYYGLEWAMSHPNRTVNAVRRIVSMVRRREFTRNANNPPVAGQERDTDELGHTSKAGLIIQVALISFLAIMLSAYMANYFKIHYFYHSGSGNEIRPREPESLEDLWLQNKLTIVAANPGSTSAYLQKSANSAQRGIYAKMLSQENHVKSTLQGVELLRQADGYAFSMEEIGAKYISAMNCEFDVLPNVYGPKKSFAIAFPQDSEFKDVVNQAILHFKETGILEELETKFRNCDGVVSKVREVPRKKRRRTIGLNMSNMAGIFCFLIIAYFFAVILGVGELWVKKLRFVRKQQTMPVERSAPLAFIEEAESRL